MFFKQNRMWKYIFFNIFILAIVIICIVNAADSNSVNSQAKEISTLNKKLYGNAVKKIQRANDIKKHPAITADIPAKYHSFLYDNNIYSIYIDERPNITVIKKNICYYGINKELVLSFNVSDKSFASRMLRCYEKNKTKQYNELERKNLSDGCKIVKYDITSIRLPESPVKSGKLILLRIFDSNKTIIWEDIYETSSHKQIGLTGDSIITIKKLANAKYMIVQHYTDNVIYINSAKKIAEAYCVPMEYYSFNFPSIYPKSVTIMSDNVIRAKYSNGAIGDYKIKLSTDDAIHNYNSCNNINCQLLWWSGNEIKELKINKIKAWNFNKNSKKIPIYKK